MGRRGSVVPTFEGMTAIIDVDPATMSEADSTESDAADTNVRCADIHREFEQIATPLLGTLYRVAWRLTGSTTDAEDLVQDTMVRAYSAFPALQDQTFMKAWFVRIMRNIWIDDYRRSQRRPIEWLTNSLGDSRLYTHMCREYSTRENVERQLFGSTPDTAVTVAFRLLPEDLRRAMYFAYVEGFPYKEIARLERIPVGTVMSRLHRGRRKMRVLLEDFEPDLESVRHAGAE